MNRATYILTAALLLATTGLHAQHSERRVRCAVQGGLEYDYFGNNTAGGAAGFNAGLLVDIPWGDFYIGTGLLFTNKVAHEYGESPTRTGLNYLEIPLTAAYPLFMGKGRYRTVVMPFAGFYLSPLLKSNMEFYPHGSANTIDAGFKAGLIWEAVHNIRVVAEYDKGFIDTNAPSGVKARINGARLSLQFMFH